MSDPFGTTSSVVCKLLIRFSRFGLIEKEPNRHWVLRGLTRSFAEEVFDVREMFERRASEAFLDRDPRDGHHNGLLNLTTEHHRIADAIDTAFGFARLDEAFHDTWIIPFAKRFAEDFFGLVSIHFPLSRPLEQTG